MNNQQLILEFLSQKSKSKDELWQDVKKFKKKHDREARYQSFVKSLDKLIDNKEIMQDKKRLSTGSGSDKIMLETIKEYLTENGVKITSKMKKQEIIKIYIDLRNKKVLAAVKRRIERQTKEDLLDDDLDGKLLLMYWVLHREKDNDLKEIDTFAVEKYISEYEEKKRLELELIHDKNYKIFLRKNIDQARKDLKNKKDVLRAQKIIDDYNDIFRNMK